MNQLEIFGPNIWVLSHELKRTRGLGCRMTVVRNHQGELFLISPVELNDSVVAQLASLGKVLGIIAPNGMHHLFITSAKAKFPLAKVFGPKVLLRKRKDISGLEVIKQGSKGYPWEGVLDFVSVPARDILGEEIVFFHLESKTLVVADLIFNLQKVEGFIQILFLKWNKAYRQLGMTKLGRFFFKDKKILREKVKQILQWQPEKLVVSHGENLFEKTTARLAESFSWLL